MFRFTVISVIPLQTNYTFLRGAGAPTGGFSISAVIGKSGNTNLLTRGRQVSADRQTTVLIAEGSGWRSTSVNKGTQAHPDRG